jgi:uncharacterized protein YxjI
MLVIVMACTYFAKTMLVVHTDWCHIAHQLDHHPSSSRLETNMHKVLNRNLYLVKEHAGLFKSANNFDIYDPSTNEQILQCREDRLGFFTKMLRFTDYKRYTPFDIEVRLPSGQPILHVRRGITIFLSKVVVHDGDENGTVIGGFKQKLFSIGGAFQVLDAHDKPICHLKGKWTGWDFRFLAGDKELAHVAKKWSGLGKELFTSADNYVLEINPNVPPDSSVRQLILAAVLCIDMVLKE